MLAAMPLFGGMKLLHILIGMSGTGVNVTAVPYPCKVTQISHEGHSNKIIINCFC